MRMVLLRHGRTAANDARLYCGATDVALSEAGRAQLLARRERVHYPEVDGLLRVTSGMLRADETLRILFGAEPELRLPGLREMNFGRFEMHSYEQLKEDADYQRWIMDASGEVSTPGGESKRDFQRRVNAAFDGLRRDALVVCHGGVIAARMEKLFPQENRNLYQWQPDSGLGYVLEERGGAWSYTTIGEE